MSVFRMTYNRQKKWFGLLFIFPWLLGFILLFAVPIVESLRYSFGRLVVGDRGYDVFFVGIKNFKDAFIVHPTFNRLLTESVINMAVNVPLILIFSLFAATLLNQHFRGRGIVRAIFFLPVILTSGVIVFLENQSIMAAVMDGATYGGVTGSEDESAGIGLRSFQLEILLFESGMSPVFIQYLTGAVDRIYEIISASGVQILIFLAGLQAISPSLYEAAKIEGATGYEIFWKISFPMVSPLILTNVIYTIIDSFTVNPLTELIRQITFTDLNFGLGSAMSWLYFLTVGILLIIVAALVSKRVFYYD